MKPLGEQASAAVELAATYAKLLASPRPTGRVLYTLDRQLKTAARRVVRAAGVTDRAEVEKTAERILDELEAS